VKVAALAALASVLLVAGCGGSSYTAASPSVVKRLLVERLDAKHLTFHWVACLRTGRTYRGAAIVRCNVNFGDPHIEAYCSLLRNGRLVTNHEDSAIPCRHDDAGPEATIIHS
jgi:hypothetical protein